MIDTQSRHLTMTRNANGYFSGITDAASTPRSWGYHYGTAPNDDLLTSYTDPNTKTTSYGYDGNNHLNKITTPGGEVTLINYDANGRIASIVRTTDAGHTTGPTTKYYYSTATGLAPCTAGLNRTIVTDPDYTGSTPPTSGSWTPAAHTTTYCTNAQDQLMNTWDGNNHQRQSTYTPNGDADSLTAPGNTTRSTPTPPSGSGNLESVQLGSVSGSAQRPEWTFDYTSSTELYQPRKSADPQNRQLTYSYTTSAPTGLPSQTLDQLATQNHVDFTYETTAGAQPGYAEDVEGRQRQPDDLHVHGRQPHRDHAAHGD